MGMRGWSEGVEPIYWVQLCLETRQHPFYCTALTSFFITEITETVYFSIIDGFSASSYHSQLAHLKNGNTEMESA